ncbi:TMhelix containing protein [Vibrio phage 1.074.O._10N.222.49.B7]|nr:TMhelix containing protein [Vibrio phage 1.074.O._10N.222.49.B7]
MTEVGVLFILGVAVSIVAVFELMGAVIYKIRCNLRARPESRCKHCRVGTPKIRSAHIDDKLTIYPCDEDIISYLKKLK